MSQPLVTAYFNTRKRHTGDDPHGKSKVLLLEQEQLDGRVASPTIGEDAMRTASNESEIAERTTGLKVVHPKPVAAIENVTASKVVHNIQFGSPRTSMEKTENKPRVRATGIRRVLSADSGQTDIRESLQKIRVDANTKKVPFEKKGLLSPKKMTSKKATNTSLKDTMIKEESAEKEQLAAGSVTPTKRTASITERLARDKLSLDSIKNRINKSSRLMELKTRIARIKEYDQQLESLQKQNDAKKPQIQKFEKIELEIPVSPQKSLKSPTKDKNLSKTMSPQRRILFEPKELTPSPVKGSPVKKPAYQKYLSLADDKNALVLPNHYRFLAEVFRCVETVSAMLFNKKELITFNKLKPAVQELLRHNFTLDQLAQIKTIYSDAYTYHQEKCRNFGSVSKQEEYQLVLTPVVDATNGRITPDSNNILKTASESIMGPTVLLERRRKFYNILLERVKDEHEQFLLNLETPMKIPREKIMRWHPDFDVERCKQIEKAELPQLPQVEKPTAKDVLDKAKSPFYCGTRMEKALQRLAEANLTSKSTSSSTQNSATNITEATTQKVNISIIDTPPTTPTTQKSYLDRAFKGIPKALLEKVRAKQAARALEAMTRTPTADKEATLYSRLPDVAKILRNIFVAEKKGVLPLEAVIQKLDNSYRVKLTSQEMQEHIRLLCKLLPTWTNIHNVRKIDYLKLDRNVDIAKMIKRLEILANEKVNKT